MSRVVTLYRQGHDNNRFEKGHVSVILESYISDWNVNGSPDVYVLTWKVSGNPVEREGDFSHERFPTWIEQGRGIIESPADLIDGHAVAIRKAIATYDALVEKYRNEPPF